MTEQAAESGWFADLEPGSVDEAREAIDSGEADTPAAWPELAVAAGFAETESEYYDLLHEATISATRATVAAREQADDKQLLHAVRAMDDADRTANELAERLSEWAGTLFDECVRGQALDWSQNRPLQRRATAGDPRGTR